MDVARRLFPFPHSVNERAARLVAAVVSLSLCVALIWNLPWLVTVLAVGFLLRVAWGPRVSPLARVAVAAADRLWGSRPVPGAPKRFAQAIGGALTCSATVLFVFHDDTAGWVLAGLVAAFAAFEALLAFCAGCFLFAQLQRMGAIRPDTCARCVD